MSASSSPPGGRPFTPLRVPVSPRLPFTASPPRPLNVYLSGLIGSGKTAIGERLAAKLGWPFYDLDREMDRLEKSHLLKALETTGGNRTEASKILNISLRSLRYRLQKHGIE